jgi:peptide/nickel transport system permease protein
MADSSVNQDALSQYDELPDAPPKKKITLSWVGKLGVVVVVFWLVMIVIGPMIAPFHEADIIGNDSFMPVFSTTEGEGFHLFGTDYIERDIFSRILWGARTTLGISFSATLLAYFIGITLGITAAVSGG